MQRKEAILLEWMDAVRQRYPLAAKQSEPILVNTMPKFIDNLVEALSPNHPRKLATEGCTIAQEHGGERARVTSYNLEGIFIEYNSLREIVLKTLLAEGPLSEHERAIVRASIDEASKQAALAFTLVLDRIRQQFIAMLSHDMRGPLTAAKANMEMIVKYPERKDRHAHFAVKAIENLKRTDKMISDLLDASKIQVGETLTLELEECDAVEIVRSSFEEMVTTYGERVTLKCDLNELRVCWNPGAIQRVIENLINNAVKYGSPHSPITMELKAQHERAVLTVHNEGAHIPVEEQETIFKAFTRSTSARKGAQQGWGLGLALVRGVAEAHGGSVIMESTLEKGNTFGIDILTDARKFVDVRKTEQA